MVRMMLRVTNKAKVSFTRHLIPRFVLKEVEENKVDKSYA